MSVHDPGRVRGQFFGTGTYVLLALMTIGYSYGLARFLTGLGTVTNLTDAYPWGIWVAIDVACGVALAAGGFTCAALIEIFGRKQYHALLRPAILTAWLGYLMVGVGLAFDLGRYWNSWRPVFNWQGNSVLFEVGMCVMAYLFVLTVEMSASFLDGFRERVDENLWGAAVLRRLETPLYYLRRIVGTVMPLFVIAGVVLSLMHQSSLGALMLIAPTKVCPLWYTPVLPLLFLLSAMMVGFPMVMLESILASRFFGREIEIDVLGPLARIIPWFIGTYGAVRLLDLFVRRAEVPFLDSPGHMIAFLIEMIACLLVPFVLLLQKPVRRSPGWLLFSALLVVAGVVLNRINVFVVAYEPPFPGAGYVPSIGEIAVTVGLVCTIMFLYRLFVFLFPILAGSTTMGEGLAPSLKSPETLSTGLAWTFRGVAAGLLVLFSVTYAVVHEEAVYGDIEATRWVQAVTPVSVNPEPLAPAEHARRPEGYKRVYILSSRLLEPLSDFFEPVRFTHVSHDEHTDGNCAVCHHRFSMDEEDRVGWDLGEFHREFDVRLGGPCASCHDMDLITTQRCDSCHRYPNEADDPSRLGLKGAYHRQCMGCHEDQPSAMNAPTDCVSCHHPLTPVHSYLVSVPEGAAAHEVIEVCLECHEQTGKEILETAHWNWSGHSPEVCGHEDSSHLGLETLANNYMIGAAPNKTYCGTCHIGLGCLVGRIPFKGPSTIDCFVCHDTSGTYRKELGGGGAPDPSVDLTKLAHAVGRPSRGRCGSCHFYSDGGANIKHGDLEPILEDPPDEFDVHMGRYDLLCQDCHTTRRHRIAGMSLSAPVVEGRVRCVTCHGGTPHGISGPLSRHLDDHVGSIACEVCHIPTVAKDLPTRVFIDYEMAGEYGPVPADGMGRPVYPAGSGVEEWVKDLVPVYEWYDETREVTVLGDEIDPSEPVVLNLPLGERRNPKAKISAFKVHRAMQPYDSEHQILVVPKLWNGFWTHFDLGRAIAEGMAETEMEYSGRFAFVETIQYSGIHHEVVPASAALGCGDCHEARAIDCQRCHKGAVVEETAGLGNAVYPEAPHRLDFGALGYEDDPARTGGRFLTSIGRGRPVD